MISSSSKRREKDFSDMILVQMKWLEKNYNEILNKIKIDDCRIGFLEDIWLKGVLIDLLKVENESQEYCSYFRNAGLSDEEFMCFSTWILKVTERKPIRLSLIFPSKWYCFSKNSDKRLYSSTWVVYFMVTIPIHQIWYYPQAKMPSPQ